MRWGETAAGADALAALDTAPAQHLLDGGEAGELEGDADDGVDTVLRRAGAFPIAAAGAVVKVHEHLRNHVIEGADAAVGAHEEAGGEHLVVAVEDHGSALLEESHAVKVEIGVLQPGHVGDGAEIEHLVEGVHAGVAAGEEVHQQRRACSGGDGFVVGASLSEPVIAGRR